MKFSLRFLAFTFYFFFLSTFALFYPSNQHYLIFAKSSNGSQNLAPKTKNFNAFIDDDDDDDDDLNDFNFFMPPSQPKKSPSSHSESKHKDSKNKVYSLGGTSSSPVKDPTYSEKGFHVGGSPANGVIHKSDHSIPVVNIDSQTGDGTDEQVVDFNFPEIDIVTLAQTLGKITGKNFIHDQEIRGKVKITSNGRVSLKGAWQAFLTALDIYNYTIIPSGEFLRIAKQREAREKQLPIYTDDNFPNTDSLVTRVIPLKYITSAEIYRTLRDLLPNTARMIAYDQTNTIIVTDTGANIKKLTKIISLLDVEGFDAGIEVIPVKYAAATELQKLIDALIPGTAPGTAASSSSRFSNSSSLNRFNARKTKEGGIINTIIADERTNTLILHANAKGTTQVRALVHKLDQRPTNTAGGKVRVIYLQFADATELANTLNTIAQSGGRAPTSGTGSTTAGNPTATTLFESSIKVAPDKATNALVITASPSDFVTLQKVIYDLDINRSQVYIEIILMEINVNNSFNFSNNVILPDKGLGTVMDSGSLTSLFSSTPFSLGGAILSFPLTSKSVSVTPPGSTTPIPDLKSVMDFAIFLQQNSYGTVLATPQVIALDNIEANFEASEKIPIRKTTNTANIGSVESIDREPVSISITVKPQINKLADFVKLDINTKYADLNSESVPKSLKDQAFSTTERVTKTSVVVADKDTIVLGGLMREKVSETTKKVPFLGDIPILGWLFKSTITENKKTNLLIFMTPKIVRKYDHFREILDKKLKERHQFVEKYAPGEDPQAEKRDDMIRSLPSTETLEKHSSLNNPMIKSPRVIETETPPEATTDSTKDPSVEQAPAEMP